MAATVQLINDHLLREAVAGESRHPPRHAPLGFLDPPRAIPGANPDKAPTPRIASRDLRPVPRRNPARSAASPSSPLAIPISAAGSPPSPGARASSKWKARNSWSKSSTATSHPASLAAFPASMPRQALLGACCASASRRTTLRPGTAGVRLRSAISIAASLSPGCGPACRPARLLDFRSRSDLQKLDLLHRRRTSSRPDAATRAYRMARLQKFRNKSLTCKNSSLIFRGLCPRQGLNNRVPARRGFGLSKHLERPGMPSKSAPKTPPRLPRRTSSGLLLRQARSTRTSKPIKASTKNHSDAAHSADKPLEGAQDRKSR